MDTITTEPVEINRTFLSSIISGDESIQVEISESKTKVLIVDDERETAEEIAELLTFDSFMQCEIADDPIQAMDIAETDRDISIIITDLNMPGLDGLQMIQKLRDRYNSNRDFAVIVITGHAGTKEAIKALQLGAMDFITKPISPDHLLHAVGRASETLQLRKLEKQFRERLEHKVEERTQEVRLLSDDLLRANRNLQKFLDRSRGVKRSVDGIGFGLTLANISIEKLGELLMQKNTDEQGNQNTKREKRGELILANKELAFQNKEKDKRADELTLANEEKEKRASELVLANKELAFQNEEKDKRADELTLANEEKEKRANELTLANKEKKNMQMN